MVFNRSGGAPALARLCLLAAIIAQPAAGAAADALDDFNTCAQLGDDDAIAACIHGEPGSTPPAGPPAGQSGSKPFNPEKPATPAAKKEQKPEPPLDVSDIGSWKIR